MVHNTLTSKTSLEERSGFHFTFGDNTGNSKDPAMVVVPVFERPKKGWRAGDPVALLPDDHKIFNARRNECLIADCGSTPTLVLGLGAPETLDEGACEEIGAALQKAVKGQSKKLIYVNPFRDDFLKNTKLDSFESYAAHIASGMLLKSYSFTGYKTFAKEEDKNVANIVFPVANSKKAEAVFAQLRATAEGVYLARDLGNEPPNVAYPASIANKVVDTFKDSNVSVRVIDPEQLKNLGAGGILAVGQGSRRPPRMVVMEYDGTGGKSKRPDLALVGKGVTFDTGGISIKSASNMDEMKYDMCGSADVIGAMVALSLRNANTHVVAVVGLAENMPDGNAYRPGDVISLMSGKTVEIINTDAEGRLVLSDCLTYVEKTYSPKAIIDLATLTGACITALGHTMAAVITRDEKLERKIVKAGRAVDELCHPLPLHDDFTKAVKGSKIADLKNSTGPAAGSSCAGAFLEQAILKKTPWAHLDIAGMAWNAPGKLRPDDDTASGFGVRLLDCLIRDNFEHADRLKNHSAAKIKNHTPGV